MDTLTQLLVVDDEDAVLKVCRASLSPKEGYEVATASTGGEALAHLQQRRFDILLTDLEMPDMRGMDLMRQARELDPGLDVLIMTGYATMDTMINTLDKGAYDYIIKPLDVWLLRAALKRCAERRALKRALSAASEAGRSLSGALESFGAKVKPFGAGPKDIEAARRSLEDSIQRMQGALTALDALEKEKKR